MLKNLKLKPAQHLRPEVWTSLRNQPQQLMVADITQQTQTSNNWATIAVLNLT